MPPGITVIESAASTIAAPSLGIDRAYLFGTSINATATEQNTPILIKDATDFSLRFPGAPDIVVQSVKLFFANYPTGNLYFINCFDPAITNDPTNKGHLVYGINLISKRKNLTIGIAIAPQFSTIALQADRTTVFSALESLCQQLDWLHFVNCATTTDTKQEALDERALYTSPYGHSAFYYGFVQTSDLKTAPVSVIASAIALRRAKEDAPYEPPAGALYPLSGISSVVSYVDNENDYRDLRDKGVNVIQDIPKVGFCLWGARTLSTDAKFQQINSRMAISLVSRQLSDELQPLLFSSSDPQGFTRREVLRRSASILNTAYLNGGLSGSTPEEAYRFEEVESAINNLRQTQIKIYARFVDTLEEIFIQLVNVDIIPSV
ncbi:MAG: hypothetical protein F6K28_40730 [Microcoleus sp. SIO2G3]|nr:hypothetical protein [Microcoleus sp. SIO2G3]